MKTKIELEIGTKFKINDKDVIVKESNNVCHGCVLYCLGECAYDKLSCIKTERSDNKSVIFKKRY